MTKPGSPPPSIASTYWLDTRQPLANLVFVLPWLALYELGIRFGGSDGDVARNGADAWLRSWLAHTWGFSCGWLPVMAMVAVLVWQVASARPWRVSTETLAGMFAESLLFAFVLILCGQSAELMLRGLPAQPMIETPTLALGWNLRLISFLGAGLYEELIFRLCLIPLAYVAFRIWLLPPRWAWGGAIVSTSVIFALAHYLQPTSDGSAWRAFVDAAVHVQGHPGLWFGFGFRTAAGLFFALLFFWRGFGIAVGCHAVYDVVVGIVLMSRL